MALFAGSHDVAIELLQVRAQEMRIDLPVRLGATDVGGRDSTAEACFLIGKGDDPVSIDEDDSLSDLAQKTGKTLMPQVVVSAAVATSV
jgi:hypothetical protein